ncbi:MAG: hypothetical protein AB7V53_00535, partial [Dongiaceae bacterium]
MVSQLTLGERQGALCILLLLAACGLLMLGAGQNDPLGVHGGIVMLFGVLLIFVVMSGYFAPEPGTDAAGRDYDDP